MDLRKKADFYKIDPAWASLEPVPVLSTPTYGDMTAAALVKKLKIQSQKDIKQLAEAKEIAYKEGFYNGTMVIGEFKGLPVQEAKGKVRDSMIEKGLAFAYAEPEGMVVSRSSDECVVALMDQWYLDYGEPKWREQAEKYVLLPSLRGRSSDFSVGSSRGWRRTIRRHAMPSRVCSLGSTSGPAPGRMVSGPSCRGTPPSSSSL